MDRIEVTKQDNVYWEYRIYQGDVMMCGGVTDDLKKALDNAYRDTLLQDYHITKKDITA